MGYNPRVLVIDDEPVVINSCDRILSRHGFTVDGFSSGINGLEVAEKSPFDALLLDLKMPDINGIQILRKLKRSKP
ncbi:response regulator, partial [candidate division KSB1 bacterium]